VITAADLAQRLDAVEAELIRTRAERDQLHRLLEKMNVRVGGLEARLAMLDRPLPTDCADELIFRALAAGR